MGGNAFTNCTDIIDLETFSQILDMDDDEEREFSKTIVFEFFEQAEKTIIDMREGLRMKDLGVLSSLGHFLKGSSATLGLIKIKNACEAIQHLGAGQDEFGRKIDTDPKESLNQIQKKLDEPGHSMVIAPKDPLDQIQKKLDEPDRSMVMDPRDPLGQIQKKLDEDHSMVIAPKDPLDQIQKKLDEPSHNMVMDPKNPLDQIQKKLDVMEVDYQLVKQILYSFYAKHP